MASPKFPEPPASLPPTPTSEIDTVLNLLSQGKDQWLKVSTSNRIVLLKECLKDLMCLSDEWIGQSCKAKGITRGTADEGEEWVGSFMVVVRGIQTLIDALEANGQPKIPSVRKRNDGQIVAQVYPKNIREKLMLSGVTGEVWIQKGKEASQGAIYRNPTEKGKVSLVLGAGNQGSIGPLDMLYKLFVENEVVLLKMNPVNEYLGPYIVRSFRCLIEGNYLSVIYGGAEVGQYACNHELVDSIHITGSCATHDAIVWGSEENKSSNTPQNTKPISSELGCVTPIIVVPGDWSDSQLDYQARQIVSMVTQNASFNCNAGKVLVLPKEWKLTGALKDKIKHHFNRKEGRKAYYPGAQKRYDVFLEKYPNAQVIGERSEDVVPWTILPDVPAQKGEYALTVEAFCAVLAITHLEYDGSAKDFLTKSVQFCNESIWGTLSANLLIDPNTQKSLGSDFDDAIANLQYGGIGVNCWSGLVYGLSSPTWGAFPGHTVDDIVSGKGVVHNAFLLDHPEKSVVYAPFTIWPTPPWFFDHGNLVNMGKALVNFEATQSNFSLPRVILNALKG